MFYIIIIIWIILDLFTKNLALKFLYNKIDIFWNFLFLKYIENSWVAFSIQLPFIKIFTVILIFMIPLYYFYEKRNIKSNKYLLDLSFWLILAWSIWNWYERVFNGKVIDFIWIKYFAIFNLADIFITIWAVIYLYIIFKNKK